MILDAFTKRQLNYFYLLVLILNVFSALGGKTSWWASAFFLSAILSNIQSQLSEDTIALMQEKIDLYEGEK